VVEGVGGRRERSWLISRCVARSAAKLTPAVTWLGGDIGQSLEEIGVPTYVIDRAGRVRWLNRRARELFGDLRGSSFTELVAPESEQRALTVSQKLLGTARTTDRMLTLRTAAGVRMPVEVHSVVLGNGERVVGVFGLVEVIGEPEEPGRMRRRGLTPRQAEVLQALARGCSTAQIAAKLGIERETVRNHVRGVLRALGVHSRLQAVAEARRRGLVD
jgi:PAS domain S-box-containing protein